MPTEIRGMIFDIDGVLEYQGRVCPGAVEAIDELRNRGIVLRFLTNSTLKSRRSCAEGLRKRGFEVWDEEVITASYATAAYLRELRPRSCWVMLEREGLDEFKDFQQDLEDPEYIVVGDNRSRFDFDHLNKALRLLLKGAKLVGMQSELTDSSLGDTELNVGSWVGMLERASGVTAVYIGKPSPYVFDLTMKTMGLDKSEVVMVGDRVSTDVKGAKGYGIRSALLMNGEFDERELDGSIKPDFLLESVSDVLEVLE
ncbi:MAG TPA: HAD-IIA family hydrolase [Anaerolineae bacterium]|nr:HAD-IIA family hydrolase [Anaerolineae bacterium]